MNGNRLTKLKLIFAIILFLLGLYGALFTLNMKNLVRYGIDGGVDSSNDGVAIGLGIFSGLCVLASAKLISDLE